MKNNGKNESNFLRQLKASDLIMAKMFAKILKDKSLEVVCGDNIVEKKKK